MALGGMSDPFQPCEKNLKITKQLLDVTNKYGIHVLFSTKSDTTYDCDIRPDLHTFQLSITNVENHTNIEPNVPSIENRYKFYKELKNRGFKVGIRIQPFIPGVSNLKIVEMFKDADNFTLEGIKIVPQNEQCKKFILNELNLEKKDFTQMGLLNLKPSMIDRNRRMDGDYFEKPTQYWFINCKVQNNLDFEPIEFVPKKVISKVKKGEYSVQTQRSMIHPQYARRFIKQYVLKE